MTSDMGEMFNELKKARQKKKRENKKHSTEYLINHGVTFESHNDGIHLIVSTSTGAIIDFWPSTGKFIARDGSVSGRGVKNLVKFCK